MRKFISMRRQVAAAAGPAYDANAWTLDGSTNYLTRGAGLTGAVDSKKGILRIWFKLNGGDGAEQVFINSTSDYFLLRRENNNKIRLFTFDSGGGAAFWCTSTSTFVAGSGWHHLLSSWDNGTAGARHLYIDDVNELNENAFNNVECDYTRADWRIGAALSSGGYVNGCLCEPWFKFGQYLDFSSAPNRRLFDNGGTPLKPVDLGSDGSLPGVGVPELFLKNAYSTAGTNSGGGGDFTVTGTLTTATPP